jgi:hypothetical protein
MTTPPKGISTPPHNALDTLDRHWAVKVVTPEDRAAAIHYGMGVLTRLVGGESMADAAAPPDFVVPLAGAYVIAASEWLDFEGAASPSAMLSVEQEAQRAAHIEIGADRALLLAGLAQLANRQAEFRHWLRAHDDMLFPGDADAARWDLTLLRRIVELWTDVLRGAGPSGLGHAMEIIASIREERPVRELQFMATVDAADEGRMRFFLFTLFHLTEAATELLLFRLHGEPERIESHLYSHFTLARDAAGGDPRLDASFDWLYEASRRIVAQRTAQLELLPEGRH